MIDASPDSCLKYKIINLNLHKIYGNKDSMCLHLPS